MALAEGWFKPPGGRAGADPAVREALRRWRIEVGLDRFRAVGQKFTDAGARLFSYNLSFNDSFSDEEIERGMEMTKAPRSRIIIDSGGCSPQTFTSNQLRIAPQMREARRT